MSHGCRPLLLAVWLALGIVSSAAAAELDYATASLDQLVDDLAAIDKPAPGISDTGIYGAFLADDSPIQFQGGVLGQPTPTIPPQMRELVRRGVSALPILIAHLSDARPTLLVVGTSFRGLMWMRFENEYQARDRSPLPAWLPGDSHRPAPYAVKIGDVCFGLIGQIVNRTLTPVRYQPTGGLVINSPIESPVLIANVTKDWAGLDIEQHRQQLLSDLAAGDLLWFFGPALARLRYYYPDTYNSLTGVNLEKRRAFETNNQGYVAKH